MNKSIIKIRISLNSIIGLGLYICYALGLLSYESIIVVLLLLILLEVSIKG
jgi:hypothetical protein